MHDDDRKLKEFLVEAKRNTYAGNGAFMESSRPGSKDLPYKSGEYYYQDSYFGGFNFIGEEAVWYKEEIIWGMNYYGEMVIEDIPEGFSDCLKGALKCVPVDKPYRGPEYFKSGEFEYKCNCNGNFESFNGDEEIYQNGKLIYRLKFHGGSIK